MPENCATDAVTVPAKSRRPAWQKRRAPARIDRRFKWAKRIAELETEYLAALAALGRTSPEWLARARAAAELRGTAERTRERYLKGEAISLEDLVRIEGCAARAVQRLDIDSAVVGATPPAPIRERLRNGGA